MPHLYCVRCGKWLSGPDVWLVFPAGCLYPVGAAWCVTCERGG